LATAARVAVASPSTEVIILEKNDFVGGRCGSFNVDVPGKGTFRHERGPSLLLLPHVYREIFEYCGSTPEENGLEMKQCTPAYQVVFSDGDCIQLGFPRASDKVERSEEELKSRRKMDTFERNGAAKWDAYMKTCEAFLDCGLPNFIEQRLDMKSFPAFIREALRDFGKGWPLKPHSDVLDSFFESDKMRAMASFQDLYVGLEPYRNNQLLGGGVLTTTAPAVFGLLAAIELHPTNAKCGVYAPIGGFQAVSLALEKLARSCGVKTLTGRAVSEVTDEGVFYVETQANATETKFLSADLVVVNADFPYATQSLISKSETRYSPRFDWDDRFLYSSGVIAFHWSVGRSLDDLNTHNIFMVSGSRKKVEESWSVLRDASTSSFDFEDAEFNFYVHRPMATDSTAAPQGLDAILILVPCPTLLRDPANMHLSRDESIAAYKNQISQGSINILRRKVIQRLTAIPSLATFGSDDILDEHVDTPGTYADRFHCGAGSPFALSHGFKQLSLARPGPTSQKHHKLIFTGASVRPGNGVPLVLIGAKGAEEAILSKLRDTSKDVQWESKNAW
jgi:phytoene desaturase (3,4-didehydrolycopene-forming)